MYPIDPGGDYGTLIIIAEHQTEYRPLPTRIPGDLADPDGVVFTRWNFSAEERKAVAAGADMLLQVLTFKHPMQPMALWIAGHDPEKYSTPIEGETVESQS